MFSQILYLFIWHPLIRGKVVYISLVIQSPCSELSPLSCSPTPSHYFPCSKSTQGQILDTSIPLKLLELFKLAKPKSFTLSCLALLTLPVLETPMKAVACAFLVPFCLLTKSGASLWPCVICHASCFYGNCNIKLFFQWH